MEISKQEESRLTAKRARLVPLEYSNQMTRAKPKISVKSGRNWEKSTGDETGKVGLSNNLSSLPLVSSQTLLHSTPQGPSSSTLYPPLTSATSWASVVRRVHHGRPTFVNRRPSWIADTKCEMGEGGRASVPSEPWEPSKRSKEKEKEGRMGGRRGEGGKTPGDEEVAFLRSPSFKLRGDDYFIVRETPSESRVGTSHLVRNRESFSEWIWFDGLHSVDGKGNKELKKWKWWIVDVMNVIYDWGGWKTRAVS